jgi:hypothetical protein
MEEFSNLVLTEQMEWLHSANKSINQKFIELEKLISYAFVGFAKGFMGK